MSPAFPDHDSPFRLCFSIWFLSSLVFSAFIFLLFTVSLQYLKSCHVFLGLFASSYNMNSSVAAITDNPNPHESLYAIESLVDLCNK